MLVISPPLEPALLIRLHSWLKEVVMADVDQTVGSWGEETLLKSSLRTPKPLLQMLAELPYVSEVGEEPHRRGEWDVDSAVKSLGGEDVTRSRLYSAKAVSGDSEGRVKPACSQRASSILAFLVALPRFIALRRSHTL